MSKPTLRLHRPKSNSCRNLGNNYALAWKTGHGTHLTLLYFENVKRGYEQDRLKNLADDFIKESDLCINYMDLGIDFENPEMWTDRSVLVKSKDLLQLQKELFQYFQQKKFKLRPLHPLHIDLRGQSVNKIDQYVDVRQDWLW